LDRDSPSREYAKEIVAASERARDLVREILMFSRRIDTQRRPVRMAQIVEEAMRLLRPTLPSTIQIEFRDESADGFVLADSAGLHQIVMNLCTNAYHAMEERGGRLTIALSEVAIDVPLSIQYSRLGVGERYLRLSVEDTGSGIPADALERIF